MYTYRALISHTTTIYSKEVYQKPEMLYLSAGADDETDSCTIQSTPCYTDSSVEHLIKFPANVPERKDGVHVVILLSITFFVQVSEMQYYAMSLSFPISSGAASMTESVKILRLRQGLDDF